MAVATLGTRANRRLVWRIGQRCSTAAHVAPVLA